MRVRGDGGNAIPARTSREILLALKRGKIDLFVSAPLFLVEAGHAIWRRMKFRKGRSTLEALDVETAGGVQPNEDKEMNVVVMLEGSAGCGCRCQLPPLPVPGMI